MKLLFDADEDFCCSSVQSTFALDKLTCGRYHEYLQ
jgi:hypothetical protein